MDEIILNVIIVPNDGEKIVYRVIDDNLFLMLTVKIKNNFALLKTPKEEKIQESMPEFISGTAKKN